MPADNVAVCIEKITVRVILACVLLYKVGIAAVLYKAYILAVGFMGIYKSLRFGNLSRLRFSHLAERKDRLA